MRPEAIRSAAAALACAMAEADRSMARMWQVTSRAATARAAAPGPQPISRTRECGWRGSASTIAARRVDSPVGIYGSVRVGPAYPCCTARGDASAPLRGATRPQCASQPASPRPISGVPLRNLYRDAAAVGDRRIALAFKAAVEGSPSPRRKANESRCDGSWRCGDESERRSRSRPVLSSAEGCGSVRARKPQPVTRIQHRRHGRQGVARRAGRLSRS